MGRVGKNEGVELGGGGGPWGGRVGGWVEGYNWEARGWWNLGGVWGWRWIGRAACRTCPNCGLGSVCRHLTNTVTLSPHSDHTPQVSISDHTPHVSIADHTLIILHRCPPQTMLRDHTS